MKENKDGKKTEEKDPQGYINRPAEEFIGDKADWSEDISEYKQENNKNGDENMYPGVKY